jgi:hypothetical protein
MGYTGTSTIIPSMSNHIDFQAWGHSISNMFLSCSWVTESTVTNATGDWSIVSRSASTNTKTAFEVWKMNDGLATGSLRNVYVRIDYGTTQAIAVPGYWITVGTSCSTLGVIGSTNGGAFGPYGARSTGTTPSLGPFTSYISGDSSRLNILFYGQTTGTFTDIIYHSFLGIERLKDTSGADIADKTYRQT